MLIFNLIRFFEIGNIKIFFTPSLEVCKAGLLYSSTYYLMSRSLVYTDIRAPQRNIFPFCERNTKFLGQVRIVRRMTHKIDVLNGQEHFILNWRA